MSERMEMCDLCDGSGYVRASTNATTPACVAAIRDHLGGKPELVGELVEILHWYADQDNDGWRARAILSRIDHG